MWFSRFVLLTLVSSTTVTAFSAQARVRTAVLCKNTRLYSSPESDNYDDQGGNDDNAYKNDGGDDDSYDEEDTISRLISKRDEIKRMQKKSDDLAAGRPVREASASEKNIAKRQGSQKQQTKDNLDFLAEFEDENDLHIPNRIGFTTVAWGDPKLGFVDGGKLSKKMRRDGKFVPGDLQAAYNLLLENGVSFVETSDQFGTASRSADLSAEYILARCMEENSSLEPIVAGTFANSWSHVLTHGLRFGSGAVVRALENSCERMDTSSIELYQVQSTSFYPGGRGALATGLEIAVEEGYCNYVGIQNAGIRAMKSFARKLEDRDVSLTSNQFEFSLTNRKAWKSGLIDACKELGVIPLVRNPLDGGLASGKYTATNPSGGEAGGVARYSFSKLEKLQPLHSVQETVAERASTRVRREIRDVQERMRRYGPAPKVNTDITATHVAINYVIAKGAVPLCDVTDTRQAQEVIGCLGWSLTDDEVDMLDAAADLCGL